MSMPSERSSKEEIKRALDGIEHLSQVLAAAAPAAKENRRFAKQVGEALDAAARHLLAAAEKLDPILRPTAIFDPADPATAGRVVALTLVAQDRHPLASVPAFYGAGVYAIYYTGPLDLYAPIAGKDHPIYVGKADPAIPNAKTAVEQGWKLSERLAEHAKSIKAASSTLDVRHFECRFLIVQSGFQAAAEEYLIRLFTPVWNSQTKLCFGIGKHGDSSGTRGNKRSPWDTMHPGRRWAADTDADQKSSEQIRSELTSHFSNSPPYRDVHAIFEHFMQDMRQLSAERFTAPSGETVSVTQAFQEQLPWSAEGSAPADEGESR